MKKATLILLLALINITAIAQAPFIQWQKSLGGSSNDVALAVIHTSDSGYMALCATGSTDGNVVGNHGSTDVWLVKMSAWGDIVWQKCIGGSGDDQPTAIQQTADGGYIVAALSNSTDGDVTGNHGNMDYWIVKLDDTGKIQWEKSYGGALNDFPNAIRQTTDGGYIVAGWTYSSDGDVTGNHGAKDVWVIKLTASGSLVWQKNYGGSSDDVASSVLQAPDGSYVIAGLSGSTDGDVTGNHGGDDIWILNLSATGTIIWENSYGGSGDEDDGDESYPGSLVRTFDGGYVVAGQTDSYDGQVTGYHGGALFDYWVIKVSGTGSLVWQKALGGTNDDDGYSVRQTADSGFIVSGTSNSVDGDVTGGHGTYDYWIVKLSSAGNLVWEKSYGGSLDEYAYCIQVASDSEYIVCGYSASNDADVSGNHGGYDAWIVKLAYCSLPTTGAITGPSVMCIGGGVTLSDASTGGTWSASNSNVTVSGGVVNGVYEGADAIFYTITNSCGTGGATHVVNITVPHPVIVAAGLTLSTTVSYSGYQWILGGTAITGATNPTYTATSNGSYSVTVTDSNGCSATSSVHNITTVGVNITNSNKDSYVLPNPTTGNIYIKGIERADIKVYDIIGQLIKEARNTDNISISELSTGMYFIRLYDAKGLFLRQDKILKE